MNILNIPSPISNVSYPRRFVYWSIRTVLGQLWSESYCTQFWLIRALHTNYQIYIYMYKIRCIFRYFIYRVRINLQCCCRKQSIPVLEPHRIALATLGSQSIFHELYVYIYPGMVQIVWDIKVSKYKKTDRSSPNWFNYKICLVKKKFYSPLIKDALLIRCLSSLRPLSQQLPHDPI